MMEKKRVTAVRKNRNGVEADRVGRNGNGGNRNKVSRNGDDWKLADRNENDQNRVGKNAEDQNRYDWNRDDMKRRGRNNGDSNRIGRKENERKESDENRVDRNGGEQSRGDRYRGDWKRSDRDRIDVNRGGRKRIDMNSGGRNWIDVDREDVNRGDVNRVARNRSEGNRVDWNANDRNRNDANRNDSNRKDSNRKESNRKDSNRNVIGRKGRAENGAADKKSKGKEDADTRKVKSPCPVSKKCGGCRWIHKSYEEQLKQKEKWVKELLQPYCSPEPIIGMEDPSHYRNKVHAVFGEDKKHNPISGIYEEGTHYIVPVDSCLIENKKADEIIVSVRGLLKSFKIRPYNEDTGYGLLRHVLIRTGHVTGEIMVVLVLSSPVMPSKNNFVKALLKLHPEITTVVVNVNNRSTTMVLGDKEQVIYGKGYIEDVLCGMTFRISPKSFYQVNPVQAEKLYQKAMEYADLTGTETVVDAYCGTGTIGLIASGQAGKVIGVELNADAVRDARNNARCNDVKNIQFYQNDAGKFLIEMAEQQAPVDVLLMDPPRSGSDEAFLGAVAKIRPQKVVYISCNPETLVRDLKVLRKSGYEVKRGGGVDMFPFTDHVECVCLMTRKEK